MVITEKKEKSTLQNNSMQDTSPQLNAKISKKDGIIVKKQIK
jgi:hypothetical protein